MRHVSILQDTVVTIHHQGWLVDKNRDANFVVNSKMSMTYHIEQGSLSWTANLKGLDGCLNEHQVLIYLSPKGRYMGAGSKMWQMGYEEGHAKCCHVQRCRGSECAEFQNLKLSGMACENSFLKWDHAWPSQLHILLYFSQIFLGGWPKFWSQKMLKHWFRAICSCQSLLHLISLQFLQSGKFQATFGIPRKGIVQIK